MPRKPEVGRQLLHAAAWSRVAVLCCDVQETNDITAAIAIDTKARMSVDMPVPEGHERFTKSTRLMFASGKLKSIKVRRHAGA